MPSLLVEVVVDCQSSFSKVMWVLFGSFFFLFSICVFCISKSMMKHLQKTSLEIGSPVF